MVLPIQADRSTTRPVALYYSCLQYQSAARRLLEANFEVDELADPRYDKDVNLARADVLFAPLGFPVDAAKMDRCPRLRAIVSNTTGIPHIDHEAATARGIHICALHNEQAFLAHITPTAEHTIGLMIAAARRLPAAHSSAAAGNWSRWEWGAPRMFSRMRLGIVGMGRIGSKVAEIARAMGMTVDFYDPNVPGGQDSIVDLARNSDVLTLHAPSVQETWHLVSRSVLQSLPKDAIVVNTARGELLDTDALIDLLESGHLWAAALDTVDGEFAVSFRSVFASSRIATYARNHGNLVLTPHIGGSTRDAWSETQVRVVEKAVEVMGLRTQ